MSIYRSCRLCGRQISGRVDKKFCDDYCRSNYNNKMRSHAAASIRTINTILRHNRKVLNSMALEEGESYALRSSLEDQGFNFDFYTQIHMMEDGTSLLLCYDYAWRPVDELRVKVMRWKSELTEVY